MYLFLKDMDLIFQPVYVHLMQSGLINHFISQGAIAGFYLLVVGDETGLGFLGWCHELIDHFS